MSWNARSGGTAFEITFATIEEMSAFSPTQAILLMRKNLQYFSVHLPFKGIAGYDASSCSRIADAFAPVATALSPDAAVVHVELVRDWESLFRLKDMCGVPVAIENADCRKNIVDDVPVLLDGARGGFRLVFDIAHARSRVDELSEDPLRWPALLRQGEPLARALSHIHASVNAPGGSHRKLSGNSEKNKVLKYLCDGVLAEKPVILEGPLEKVTARSLACELGNFIRT
jgi:hypothetical protein